MAETKTGQKGPDLEETLKAYFWQAGYFAVRSVPFRLDDEDITKVCSRQWTPQGTAMIGGLHCGPHAPRCLQVSEFIPLIPRCGSQVFLASKPYWPRLNRSRRELLCAVSIRHVLMRRLG